MANNSAYYQTREILKSFAYGASVDDVANVYGISKSEATKIKNDNAADIEDIKKHYEKLTKK